jgi:acyl-CoA synthetase (AMP-forming)/AMP-acid ligase II
MTETSPVTFATNLTDSIDRWSNTVGTVFPHTGAKIVGLDGEIVPRGVAGEICTSGFALQKGYLNNDSKTCEAMRPDADGVLWIYTGDEGVIDSEGYCRITARIKDMIIRGTVFTVRTCLSKDCANTISSGGENIMPGEIEERLQSHARIVEASVIGAPHPKYGESVAAFVRQAEEAHRPTDAELVTWVQETLGRHKTPENIFWIGDERVCANFPKTASGKHQKHLLQDLAARLLKSSAVRSKL